MGKIITHLTKNLIIFRPDDEEKDPNDDYLFYVYDEYLNKVTEYISEDRLEEMGIELISIMELYTNNVKKVASLVTPIAKQPNAHSISYNTFGFFLLVKFSIDSIISYTYAKGLIRLANDIAKDIAYEDFKVTYNLAIYFLENFGYKEGLDSSIVSDLQNFQTFKKYYEMFHKKITDITEDNLTTTNIKRVFEKFNEEFEPKQKT